VVVSGGGTPAPQQSKTTAPVDIKGKGPATELDLKRPAIEQGVLDIIWGLERFAVMDIPHNPQAWPKIVRERLYPTTPPPEYGDYFAVSIRDEWEPMVSPEIVEGSTTCLPRLHGLRCAGRRRARPRLLPSGSPTLETPMWCHASNGSPVTGVPSNCGITLRDRVVWPSWTTVSTRLIL
jgi:hypothetical protein